ncbi:deazapurine DNA modification protein DpdA family protein [Streptomyces sp. GB4-14]|uniref:deazapurine DNA modification protein DpdA family protein n=1 Tax=Streptomyces sp. GB4-14 TaxID=2498703 RepID=UPI003FCF56C1
MRACRRSCALLRVPTPSLAREPGGQGRGQRGVTGRVPASALPSPGCHLPHNSRSPHAGCRSRTARKGALFECAELYEKAGVDLRAEPVVGLGSVCRLQSTREGAAIVTAMAAHGFRLHGFGFKILGLERVGHLLASADSAAWSSHARRRPPLLGHTHRNCANCIDYALLWRQRVINAIPTQQQMLLTDRSAA